VGYPLERSDAFYRCYGTLRFNYILLFDYLLTEMHGGRVLLKEASGEVERIRRLARVTGGIGLYREPNMSEDQPRKWYQIASGRPDFEGKYTRGVDAKFKAGYQRLAREADAFARKSHWPTLLYMVTDEPDKERDVHASMGWLNDALPGAITIADAQFRDLLRTWQWYNLPILDNPIDWTGPLVYRWLRGKGRRFGLCGLARTEPDVGRYQTGLMLASSGACYFHFWHLEGPMRERAGRVERSHTLAAMAAGFNDLRYFVALKQAIGKAKGAKAALVAAEAERFLRETFAFATADNDRYVMTHNGLPADWGDDRWYDRWRAKLAGYLLRLRSREPDGQ